MDEGKFVADFLAKHIKDIWSLGESVFGKLDESVQIKLKTAYKEYLLNSQLKYSKAKSFFIRNQSVDLYSYYVPTGIKCSKFELQSPNFKEITNHSKCSIILGTGGCGKSVLMRHLFLDCIKDNIYVPILIELRDLNTELMDLNKLIFQQLDSLGFNVNGDYVEKAKKAGHFCFFLDGYDEVNYQLRDKIVKAVKSLSTKYKSCPIIMSSRPDDVFNGIEEFSIFRLQPLNVITAVSLVEKLPFDKEVKSKFIIDLKSQLFNKHQSFLSNPLLLSIMLLTYGENAEIPSKLSIFYNQAFEALFQRHDANKGGYSRKRLTELDIQEFSRVFALFSLQTYEKRRFKMPRIECLNFIVKARDFYKHHFTAENYLQDLLSAACLMIEDGLEISFSHRSFQEYFVAVYISNAAPEVQEKLINRYAKNISSDDVINLLLELNPELVERILIVPKLEDMFTKIGVKNKVGVSHSAKYLKLVYTKLTVGEDDIIAYNSNKDKTRYNYILNMAISISNSYTFPDDEYFNYQSKSIFDKYVLAGEDEFELEELSYKSPILREVIEGEGAFSLSYLQAGFRAYKELKKRHLNVSEDLDEVLGI